jgi:mRNA-degrading endonuclease RelE of RelBE toxin-antitoxin system
LKEFRIEFTPRAVKDLKRLPAHTQKHILEKSFVLESAPFPSTGKIKRIMGVKFPCYRLRIDDGNDSYRMFYGIENNVVFVLRIISRKDAERIIKSIRKIDFPPER